MSEAKLAWSPEVLGKVIEVHQRKRAESRRFDEELELTIRMPEGLKLHVPQPAILTSEQLVRILEPVFWASLHRYEGRTISFSVQATLGTPMPETMTLSEVEDLSPDSLASIGIAGCGSHNCFLVSIDQASGQPKLWGFGRAAEPALRIICDGPGLVRLAVGDEVIAAMKDGQLRAVAWASNTLKEILARSIAPGAELPKRTIVAEALSSLVRAARAQAAGATFLFVDTLEKPELFGLDVAPRMQFRQPMPALKNQVAFLVENQIRAKDEIEATMYAEVKQGLETSLADLARLAAVDGAVLCDFDLRYTAFGVKIRNSNDAPKRFSRATPFDLKSGEEEVLKFKGTRHQSAVRFVAINRGRAIAIVVSHDGPATLVAFVNNTVVSLTNLEMLLPS